MRSSYDTHYSSSTSNSLRNSNYSSPLHSLDIGLSPFSGSDRAEFRDRYQNKVNKLVIVRFLYLLFLVCMA